MWTVIYIAQKQEEVQNLRKCLEAHHILVRVRLFTDGQAENGESYEVLVPAAEVSTAHGLMFDADF